jgi:hypothetical protein
VHPADKSRCDSADEGGAAVSDQAEPWKPDDTFHDLIDGQFKASRSNNAMLHPASP